MNKFLVIATRTLKNNGKLFWQMPNDRRDECGAGGAGEASRAEAPRGGGEPPCRTRPSALWTPRWRYWRVHVSGFAVLPTDGREGRCRQSLEVKQLLEVFVISKYCRYSPSEEKSSEGSSKMRCQSKHCNVSLVKERTDSKGQLGIDD